jgi:GGDEF domain-containing protein/EAL domain-containing protein (putative c-di-GMP-specific phosphodiesterase class I)
LAVDTILSRLSRVFHFSIEVRFHLHGVNQAAHLMLAVCPRERYQLSKHDSKKSDTNLVDIETCRAELEQTLASRSLSVVFRPIFQADSKQNFACLARVYGAQESSVRSIERLFAIAKYTNNLQKLIKRYFEVVLLGYGKFGKPLLLPLPGIAVNELGAEVAQSLAKALKKFEVPAESVVVIHPGFTSRESLAMANTEACTRAMRPLGVRLAGMNFGCGVSESVLWAKFPPELMLLDEGHFDDLLVSTAQLERLYGFIAAEQARGRKILVQGITNSEQFSLALHAGLDLLVGDFVGKAKPKPYNAISATALNAIGSDSNSCFTSTNPRVPSSPMPSRADNLLERLLVPQEPVEPEMTAEKVYSCFEANPDLRSLAVVKNGMPLGIISRYEMVDNMSRPFRHELFGRKPCERFMDNESLIMEVHISTPDLMDQVINAHPRHLISGFIVTDSNGHYIGMGAVQDLMREITNMQIQAARYANPLTQLPGNVAINNHLDNLLANRIDCVVAYCDLDHFKPFNDVYGYAKGDEMILLNARCLNEVIDPELDFLGHVGGDDFVLIFRSPDWFARCQRALDRFGEQVMQFFLPADIAQGGYLSANRKGDMELHALASLSIGAVEASAGLYENHLVVATVAAEVKKHAKAIKGNSLYVNRRKP